MAKITVYSTPNCPFCAKVRKYLEENGHNFEDINVAVDREGLKALRVKSGQMGVPVLDVEGTILIGFNKEKIDGAIDAVNNPK